MNAIVAEAVGAGIEANSAHPDPDMRARIDSRWLACAEEIDAEGRTDFRGLTAAMVLSEIVDGEAFAVIEAGPEGLRLRQIPAEFIDAADTRDLGDGRYIVSGIEFGADGRRRAYHVRPYPPTDLFPTAAASTAPRIAAASAMSGASGGPAMAATRATISRSGNSARRARGT